MSFISVTEETTKISAANVKRELQTNRSTVVSQIDPFLLHDFSLAIEGNYRLQIMNNLDGKTETYRLRDALINIDTLVQNMLLPLKLEVELNGNIVTLDFNISRIDPDTSPGSHENPKYYIYCDNSNQIGFRFWFIKNNK
ncbi:hypothetical protein [Paenibacillus agilis]|uniref:Uncharacterized protein n=1 Tax=Paenibacillus agilis TaxID=3020863 RepID=A0A559ID18_9BACL|nr:hypothetical protein [Paenibacillus agilis]TVX85568.1 hypothetical protein FPZ44_24750 [Paenibacillus agilis]